MSETRYFEVTQERVVKVSAKTPADAVRVANAAFNNEDHDFLEIGGTVLNPVREIDISAREEI